MDSGVQDEIEVISSFLGPTSSLRRWGWALFFSPGLRIVSFVPPGGAGLLERDLQGDKMGHGTIRPQRDRW